MDADQRSSALRRSIQPWHRGPPGSRLELTPLVPSDSVLELEASDGSGSCSRPRYLVGGCSRRCPRARARAHGPRTRRIVTEKRGGAQSSSIMDPAAKVDRGLWNAGLMLG